MSAKRKSALARSVLAQRQLFLVPLVWHLEEIAVDGVDETRAIHLGRHDGGHLALATDGLQVGFDLLVPREHSEIVYERK